ncbi:hypothetical protein KJK34_06265 [Flavobacterium sp. D11R37]|uniref:hypothetical protein n=1 Tax=Flavobacterium coralii TaxID=2838017 RepID=UPI001CA722B4|nr:hypothetical protein [Flavobacterium coralii]MBY8962349.1 hypothetical protein [Flavobacterium coralii]
MKKFFYSAIVAAALMVSCSDDDSSDNNNNNNNNSDGFSNNPVSGVIYNEDFDLGGGTATPITLNGVESLNIDLSESDITCDDTNEQPIWITVPAAVGSYSRQDGEVTVQFRDVNGDSFEGSLDAEVEITEMTETMVKGRIMAGGFDETENSINGTFEVTYCPL